jgi:hypothetical protein
METNKITKLLKAFKQIAPILPAIKMPGLSIPKIKDGVKLPGIKATSKKNPIKIAQQTQNKDIKDIKMKEAQESLKINKSTGQWELESLDKTFVSNAQRKFMYSAADRGEIPKSVVQEFSDKTPKGKNLPEHVKKDETDKGIKEEREHTHVLKELAEDAKNNKLKSIDHYLKGIAKDHTSKIKDYYSRLEQMEDKSLSKSIAVKIHSDEPHESHQYEIHKDGKKIKDVTVHSHTIGGKKLHWIKDGDDLGNLERAAVLKVHHQKIGSIK